MAKTPRVPSRTLDALPDTLDFRDRMFEPTLVEVPLRIPLEEYRRWLVPVLDQGSEGACTGFGLATVAHYPLRRRAVDPDPAAVSPRMFYEMAKRYDEWPGERYAGSSARGAMKGWHKHGVCSEEAWPYRPSSRRVSALDQARAADAVRRPLGAYYRVNHRDLVAMHAAISEVGVLYATAIVHDGWDRVEADGQVPYDPGVAPRGGHAFAIVAYDEAGLWLQNSWEPVGSPAASRARSHGAFDDDEATLKATMARILSVGDTAAAPVTIHRSAASARDRRQRLASIA